MVVRLCHHLLKLTQQSLFKQFASTLSDSDLKTYERDLGVWVDFMKEEISLLTAKSSEHEAQENARFRDLLGKLSGSALYRQMLKRKLDVLNSCSTYDYKTTWKQTRKIGNTTLFSRTDEYTDWKKSTSSGTFVLSGKLGSGKSVSLANIVDDLSLLVKKRDTVVAYFFCRYDIPESLNAQTVIGSLTRQLLHSIPDLRVITEIPDDTTSDLDFSQLFDLLRRALPCDYRAYFVLDGLDECETLEREAVVQYLKRLQKSFAISICVSLRLEPDMTTKLSLEKLSAVRSFSIPEQNPDIESFVKKELETCIETKALVIGDPQVILEIRDALLKGSQGMFLWVALQIKSLCTMKTDTAIRQALADLPRDLPTTFSRILQRGETLGQTYQKLILELISIARRPLTTEEVREALSVVPGETTWNEANLPNDIHSTLACCGSLIIVDEEELTIRFVHHSVKQFLIREYRDSVGQVLTEDGMHMRVAGVIITYLSYGVFETQLSSVVIPQIMTGSVPSKIIRTTLDSSRNARNLALKLLRSDRAPNHDISRTIACTKFSNSRPLRTFHFYSYAKSWWFQHILGMSEHELEPVMYSMSLKLAQGNAAGVTLEGEDCWSLLWWAAQNRRKTAIRFLLDSGRVDLNSKANEKRAIPTCVAAYRHEAIVEQLLHAGRVSMNFKNHRSRTTPLSWAAMNGHLAVMELLIVVEASDVNFKDELWNARDLHSCQNKYGRTILHVAVGDKNPALVELLLKSVEIDVNIRDKKGETPLHEAARSGCTEIVQLLLANDKVNVNSHDNNWKTPLHEAAGSRYTRIVTLLLTHRRVDVNSKDDTGQTPLHEAARSGYTEVVQLLLANGEVVVDWKDDHGETPLLLATNYGHVAVVDLLLASGKVDVNIKNRKGWTALHIACAMGHGALVERLLVEELIGADTQDLKGKTPLFWATYYRQVATVELLLASGRVKVTPEIVSLGRERGIVHVFEKAQQSSS